ncbi:MAG: ATP-binding protein [Hyphomonas sp.]|uniref:AlbA family DNA-binding domain-containing protein n=1 Tax=Hyphomonas sp. TaxID=87 RepID=UPI0017945BD8|nr:hypothetical protein [Hyphomonas sp.]MBA3068589.1 ATP-binding protein [Hyphomonas sp.]MBU3921808.1 ATP-binding protein [Alphaproteobacteria bacterium]MBU4061908.1 ATP-binding protein [Alphaproteobacteria bacterium]MBU4166063.1 ATP-binding protein [Alphaproteobacteria bacterium]
MAIPSLRSVRELIENPQESLSVELKDWIDPSLPEDAAKLVKECFALRNYNGGDLIVGFDDKTLLQSKRNIPSDVSATFHADLVQQVLSKYASEPFGVSVEFGELNGISHPVIRIPSGVRVPVCVKSDLFDSKQKKLLAVDDVYFRTLNANNRPSSAKIKYRDWPALLDVCFDNREADIGRFLRRHLGSTSAQNLLNSLKDLTADQIETDGSAFLRSSVSDRLSALLLAGRLRFAAIALKRKSAFPAFGTYEAALIIEGEHPHHKANYAFLDILSSANPRLTGWPIWLDSRTFSDESTRPFVHYGVWEAFIDSVSAQANGHIDFYRYDPSGQFYLLRALQDDVAASERRPKPLTQFEAIVAVYRVTETLAVGRNFAKALGYDTETATLCYKLKWTKLGGRTLSTWANPERSLSYGRKAYQDECVTEAFIPANTPDSALPQFVKSAVDPLFEIFEGFEMAMPVIEEIVRRVLERRW